MEVAVLGPHDLVAEPADVHARGMERDVGLPRPYRPTGAAYAQARSQNQRPPAGRMHLVLARRPLRLLALVAGDPRGRRRVIPYVDLATKKTSIYLSEELDHALSRRAAEEGITKAELIRRTLEAVVNRPPRVKPQAVAVFRGNGA